MKIEFKEEQKFMQWWLWIILIGIGSIPIVGLYHQLILGEKFGDQPMSDIGLIIFGVITFGLIVLFLIMRLVTEIDENEIRINYFPFTKKKVSWKEIKNAEVVNYGFVGGWGIRFGTKYGTVYNTSGRMGLAVELLNGKKFLIGTQKYAQLKEIIKKTSMHKHL